MRHVNEESAEGLDSFMDIVTNVIGLMVLIAAAIVLNAQEIAVTLGAPILRNPPHGAEALFFDCAKGTVVPRQPEVLLEKTDAARRRRHQELGYAPGMANDVEWLNSQSIGSEFYTYDYQSDGHSLSANLVARSEQQGETLDDLRTGASDFEEAIASLDPRQYYIYFTIRDDSFSVFRQAREIARKYGLATGWRPKHYRYPFNHIIVGEGGWGGEVQ